MSDAAERPNCRDSTLFDSFLVCASVSTRFHSVFAWDDGHLQILCCYIQVHKGLGITVFLVGYCKCNIAYENKDMHNGQLLRRR